MNRNKLEFLKKLIQYAIDHHEIINDELINSMMDVGDRILYDICSETCGGAYHCSDGCPIYYLFNEMRNIK